MSIVLTECAVTGTIKRSCKYRCQDHLGMWHEWGTVFTIDANWDSEAFKTTVAAEVEQRLAEDEFSSVIA